MKHAQPHQAMETKTGKKRLPAIMLGKAIHVSSFESNLSIEEGPDSQLFSLGAAEVVLKLEKLFLL